MGFNSAFKGLMTVCFTMYCRFFFFGIFFCVWKVPFSDHGPGNISWPS